MQRSWFVSAFLATAILPGWTGGALAETQYDKIVSLGPWCASVGSYIFQSNFVVWHPRGGGGSVIQIDNVAIDGNTVVIAFAGNKRGLKFDLLDEKLFLVHPINGREELKRCSGAESEGSADSSPFPDKKLVPWRTLKILNSATTQLVIEGENGRIFTIPGGSQHYFLSQEKGGPAVNICRGHQDGAKLFLRCDRKGGFRDGRRPRPWWWRYEGVIAGDTLRIVSVAQKDGPLERGQPVSDHFHDYAEE